MGDSESGTVVQPAWVELQNKAENFSIVAGLLAVAFVVFMLAVVFTGNWNFALGGSGALAAALWLYQSAQLLHIRALLAKSSESPPAAPKSPAS